MFHIQNFFLRPVKVESDVGYLLVQAFEGVAYDPPGLASSISN